MSLIYPQRLKDLLHWAADQGRLQMAQAGDLAVKALEALDKKERQLRGYIEVRRVEYPENAKVGFWTGWRTKEFFGLLSQVEKAEFSDDENLPLEPTAVDEKLAKLVRQGICVAAKDKYEHPALHKAIEGLCYKTAEALLDMGADIEALDKNQGPTALQGAQDQRNYKGMKLLIGRGADVNVTGEYYPPIYQAFEEGDRAAAEILLNAGARINGVEDWQMIHEAAARGDVEGIRNELAKGADINTGRVISSSDTGNRNVRTPLHMAILMDKPEAVLEILDKKGIHDFAKLHPQLLFLATEYTSLGVIRTLIANGVDVNIRDESGESALYYARKPEAVRFLVAHGADVDISDEKGRAPLQYCVQLNISRAVQHALLEAGANIYSCDKQGRDIFSFVGKERFADKIAALKIYCREKYQDYYKDFYENRTPPETPLDARKLLAAIPLEDVGMPVDRAGNMRKIILGANWQSREQAEKFVDKILKAGVVKHGAIYGLMEKLEFVKGWRERVAGEAPAVGRMV